MPFGKTKGRGIECKQCLVIVLVEPAKSPGETINTMKFLAIAQILQTFAFVPKKKNKFVRYNQLKLFITLHGQPKELTKE